MATSDYPNSVWDGLTPNHLHPGDNRSMNDEDYDKIAAEMIAMQTSGQTVKTQLDALRTAEAAIANPTGGATVDAEARTAINSILAVLRTKGLIAT